jgi:hypothetical protein
MTTHTPAPWKLQDYDHAFVVWSNEGVICDVFHNREDDEADGIFSEEEATANARLIAAAPELLEALQIAKCYMEGDSDDEQEQLDYAFILEAIAKATGEEV